MEDLEQTRRHGYERQKSRASMPKVSTMYCRLAPCIFSLISREVDFGSGVVGDQIGSAGPKVRHSRFQMLLASTGVSRTVSDNTVLGTCTPVWLDKDGEEKSPSNLDIDYVMMEESR